jgi:2,3-bisphosphoglycerate-independent phosphoglycerate mutase
MKYVVLICSGMTDEPIEELGGQTPLQVAKTPAMDALAKRGNIGLAQFTPMNKYPSVDVTNLSVLGMNPMDAAIGLGSLEALAMDIPMKESSLAFRCNLVTVVDSCLADFTAGNIRSKEASLLMEALNRECGSPHIQFIAGHSYRNLLIIHDAELARDLIGREYVPPHELLGQHVTSLLTKKHVSKKLRELLNRCHKVLAEHEINQVRLDLGENPANAVWLWGPGMPVSLPTFKELYGLSGMLIADTLALKGIGKLLGLDLSKRNGDFGDDTLVQSTHKVTTALKSHDCVILYVDTPNQASLRGDIIQKIRTIESFDQKILAPLMKALKGKPHRLLLTTDRSAPINLRSHTPTPVPFLISGQGITSKGIARFDEPTAVKQKNIYASGHLLMKDFLKQ